MHSGFNGKRILHTLSQVKLAKSVIEEKKMDRNNKKSGMEVTTAQAIRLINLADYQEGSVVSRTVIDREKGTVTFFAFDEGQGLSEHTAPFDALLYLLEGEAEIIISGKALHCKEGDMVVMPANEPHALRAVKKFKMILTMIRS